MTDQPILLLRFAEKCEELRKEAEEDKKRFEAYGVPSIATWVCGTVETVTRKLESWMAEQYRSDVGP